MALRNISFQDVWMALLNADISYVVSALFIVFVNTLAKTVRWKVLMGPAGNRIGLWKSFKALLAGQALNTIYPARVGDVSRAYVVGGRGVGRIFIMGTIFLEKGFDLILYSLLLFSLIFFVEIPDWFDQSIFGFVVITLLGISIIVLIVRYLDLFTQLFEGWIFRLPNRFRDKAQKWLHSGMSSLEILRGRRELIWLGFWSFLVWATAILINYLTLMALQIKVPLIASVLILVVLQASLSLPSIPGKIGIFEYSCILALAVFGVSQLEALSYGILLHVIVLLPTTLAGLLFLGFFTTEANQPQPVDRMEDNCT